MEHVTSFGLSVAIVALRTFPQGFTVTEFSDDVMPIEFDSTQIADHEFLVDGELFDFDISSAVTVRLGVVAGSDGDQNLNALLHARRGSKIKVAGVKLPDTVAMTISYPNHSPIVLSQGYLRSGKASPDTGEDGKMKGMVYEFVFGECTQITLKGLVQAGLSLLDIEFPDFGIDINV